MKMKILVFDVGGTAIKYGMVDEQFNIIFSDEMPTDSKVGGLGVVGCLDRKMAEYAGQFDAIGISTAGQIDFKNGVLKGGTGNIPNYGGTELRKIFSEKYGVPVCVDNDVNCAGIGEAHFGAGRGADDFLCLTYGTGVGGCFYQDGDVYRGSRSAAGEFGHMIIHANGKPCNCGLVGCYETYASCRVFTNNVSERMGKPMTGREIFKEENLKNPIVIEEIEKWENEIVTGLISLSMIFNPSLIILGGGIMNEEMLVNDIRGKLQSRLSANYSHVRVEKAQLGNKAGMLGAAYIAYDYAKNSAE